MVHMLLDNKCARRNSAVDLLAEENRQVVFARFETDMARELEEAILKVRYSHHFFVCTCDLTAVVGCL